MALNSERRRQVAAMRAETRAYLHDIRVRRLAPPAEPAPEEASRPPDPAAPAAFLPDPDIAALSPAALPPAPDRRPVATDYSLDALRLLGHGMVWRLNKLGVHTLHDLAACNPEQLGESLGPIGKLVRCEVWVQAAREILMQD